MNVRLKRWLTLAAAAAMLAGCGAKGADQQSKSSGEAKALVELPTAYDNQDKAVDGGILKLALVSDSPFAGLFNPVLSQNSDDSNIMQLFSQAIIDYDESFHHRNDGSGMMTYTVDRDKNEVHLKFKDDLKWSDGEPLTVDDYIYGLEVVADKDYTGIRFDDTLRKIVGMQDYHDGKADHISGLEKIDDQNLVVKFDKINVSVDIAGGLLPTEYILPKHHLGDVPVAEMESSEKSRQKIVGNGPFRVVSVTPGESVELEANPYYFKGEPKIKKAVVEVVSASNIASEMKNGKYDAAINGIPSDQYKEFDKLDNIALLGQLGRARSYIGFKLGKWDKDKNEVVTDPKAKMANKQLRQAMGYAINAVALSNEFYDGTRTAANSPIVPIFKDVYDESIEGYSYNPEKAKQLLDEAGYKDTDGDGFREDPEGKPLVINVAAMSGGEVAEPVAQAQLQWWKDVGLNVELYNGRLMEMNSFYDKVGEDAEGLDVYLAAWSSALDPDPSGLFGRQAPFNYQRFASDELDSILADISSDKSFDEAFRKEAYRKYQAYMIDEAFEIPYQYRLAITAVNKRLKNVNIAYGSTDGGYETWEFTAEKPIK